MSLTEKEVLYVAKLAAIELKDSEVEKFLRELNDILGVVDRLQSVPTLGVEPTSHVHGTTTPFRDDVIQDSLSIEEVKKNAPDFVDSFFRVPTIIG